MLIKFFRDFGYFKAGKEYDLEPFAAEALLKNSFCCYNSEPYICTNPDTYEAKGQSL